MLETPYVAATRSHYEAAAETLLSTHDVSAYMQEVIYM